MLFARLTAPVGVPKSYPKQIAKVVGNPVEARIWVTFSTPVGFLDLKNGNREVVLKNTGGNAYEFAGRTTIDRKNPIISLESECTPIAGARVFAKLVVEADGHETFTHVFDSGEDIDDFVELPF